MYFRNGRVKEETKKSIKSNGYPNTLKYVK